MRHGEMRTRIAHFLQLSLPRGPISFGLNSGFSFSATTDFFYRRLLHSDHPPIYRGIVEPADCSQNSFMAGNPILSDLDFKLKRGTISDFSVDRTAYLDAQESAPRFRIGVCGICYV